MALRPGNNTSMNFYLKILMIGMMLITSGKLGIAQSKNFNGTWILLKDKSNFGGLEVKKAAPNLITVLIKADSIITIRVFSDSLTFQERWRIDGSDVESMTSPNTLKISNVSLQPKTGAITIQATYETNGAESVYWRTEEWDLISNGKELRMKRTTVLPNKVDRVVAVYRRKS